MTPGICDACGYGRPDPLARARAETSVLPSPSDHLEMPKRMTGRRLVRTCSCGKPWPCEKSAGMRWTALREHIQRVRDATYEVACDYDDEGKPSARAYGRVEAYDEMLATMDRMEQS